MATGKAAGGPPRPNLECCMCGDYGLSSELFNCKVCQFRSQHRYCSNLYPGAESYRVCNWCLKEEATEKTQNHNSSDSSPSRRSGGGGDDKAIKTKKKNGGSDGNHGGLKRQKGALMLQQAGSPIKKKQASPEGPNIPFFSPNNIVSISVSYTSGDPSPRVLSGTCSLAISGSGRGGPKRVNPVSVTCLDISGGGPISLLSLPKLVNSVSISSGSGGGPISLLSSPKLVGSVSVSSSYISGDTGPLSCLAVTGNVAICYAQWITRACHRINVTTTDDRLGPNVLISARTGIRNPISVVGIVSGSGDGEREFHFTA